MNKELFGNYAKLEFKIKQLEAEKKEMSALILKEIVDAGVTTVKSGFGTFSLVKRTSYDFDAATTSEIFKVKRQIKDIENKAIEAGKAKEKISESLMFRAKIKI